MKTSILLFHLLVTLCATAFLAAQQNVAHPDLRAFPPAKDGMERHVIVLPHKERGEEDAFRVELIAGTMMDTDGTNLYRLGGTLKEKHLEGWAYSFYEFTPGPTAMTLMAPRGKPVKKFVSAPPLHTNYNSRLPIVIFAPAGYEIRYRIWKADENFTTAPKG